MVLYRCLGKFSLSGKKKEKKLGKVVPDILARGGLVWPTQVGSVLLLQLLFCIFSHCYVYLESYSN